MKNIMKWLVIIFLIKSSHCSAADDLEDQKKPVVVKYNSLKNKEDDGNLVDYEDQNDKKRFGESHDCDCKTACVSTCWPLYFLYHLICCTRTD